MINEHKKKALEHKNGEATAQRSLGWRCPFSPTIVQSAMSLTGITSDNTTHWCPNSKYIELPHTLFLNKTAKTKIQVTEKRCLQKTAWSWARSPPCCSALVSSISNWNFPASHHLAISECAFSEHVCQAYTNRTKYCLMLSCTAFTSIMWIVTTFCYISGLSDRSIVHLYKYFASSMLVSIQEHAL